MIHSQPVSSTVYKYTKKRVWKMKMVSSFYMTLPSNSTLTNTAAEFSANLPVNINLTGEWEVGLAEIIYGNTWFNINNKNSAITFVDTETKMKVTWRLAEGRYETIQGLLEAMQKAKKAFNNEKKQELLGNFEFIYMDNIKRCRLKVDTDKINDLKVHPDFLYMLGFGVDQLKTITNNSGEQKIISLYPVDMSCGLNHLYVYCDIVKPQIVGNLLAPLLQIVNVEGKYVDTIGRIYITPHYVPVLKKTFNTIEMNIKDDQNRSITFEYGKTIVKLHFRSLE
jgi:hypothetical protein